MIAVNRGWPVPDSSRDGAYLNRSHAATPLRPSKFERRNARSVRKRTERLTFVEHSSLLCQRDATSPRVHSPSMNRHMRPFGFWSCSPGGRRCGRTAS